MGTSRSDAKPVGGKFSIQTKGGSCSGNIRTEAAHATAHHACRKFKGDWTELEKTYPL